MFDFGFTELILIAGVALVVLGPERMPEMARQMGRLLGKAQGYFAQVKGEFDRETQLSEVRKLRDEFATQASSIRTSFSEVQNQVARTQEEVNATVATPASSRDPYTTFNQAEATMSDRAATASFKANNPFGWKYEEDEDDSSSFVSQYLPRRYKPVASLDDVVEELAELRRQMALPNKRMDGHNKRYAPRARVNRIRIYR